MTRVNDRIRAPKIRVVYGEDSQQLGVMTTREAIVKAKSVGLDLVEIAPKADPPVCINMSNPSSKRLRRARGR
jgi:translation initiation factor IF-3